MSSEGLFSPLSPTKDILTLATAKSRRHGDYGTWAAFLLSHSFTTQQDKWHLLHAPFLWFPGSSHFCNNMSGITLCSLLLRDLPIELRFLAKCQNTVRKIIFQTHTDERRMQERAVRRAQEHLGAYHLHPLTWGNKSSASSTTVAPTAINKLLS